MRITLRYEKNEYMLDEYIEYEIHDDATKEEETKHEKHRYYSIEVSCLMFMTMSSELQKSCENLGVYDMNRKLKYMFQDQARTERFKVM